MKTLFEHVGYRAFLHDQFPAKGEKRGQRVALAEQLGCQSSFISLVITERVHMSEEMFLETCHFLKLSNQEIDFAVLLYRFERAGSSRLKSFYQSKLDRERKARSRVEQNIATEDTLTSEEKIRYYSSWLYAAVHIATTIGKGVTLNFLTETLETAEKDILDVLEFLIDCGLVIKNEGRFVYSKKRIHLSRNSRLSIASHCNWRSESIRQIQKMRDRNLHFSSVYSLSQQDYLRIRKRLEEEIIACEKIVGPSKEEQLCVLSVDLFKYGD